MSNTKHTPGPWKYRSDAVDRGFYIETVDMSHKKTFIGDVGGGLQSKYEIEANAKLIAAAPDMLEALLMIQLECDLDEWPDVEGYINAAIKKATE